jgi:hypothetical protein
MICGRVMADGRLDARLSGTHFQFHPHHEVLVVHASAKYPDEMPPRAAGVGFNRLA